VSAFGVGDSLSRQPLPIRWMITRTNLSYTYADHNLVDAEIRNTDTDWTLVRPAAFNKEPSAGKIAVTDIHGPRPSFFISRPAVAHFAVDVIDAGSHIREAPIISRNQN
jgi:uncharacterized protein YbjT (DUF2867 family)